jgi:prepilin-type N-terminal cleavage/methylation domain-containing protein
MRPSGFTLIEILMVITLVAVLSAVALPQFIDFRDDARSAVTRDRLNSFRSSILGDPGTGRTGYLTHFGSPPPSLNALIVRGAQPVYNPVTKIGWNGPYVDGTVPDWDRDAWGTALVYSGATRTLRSCGPNRSCGDGDDLTISF